MYWDKCSDFKCSGKLVYGVYKFASHGNTFAERIDE